MSYFVDQRRNVFRAYPGRGTLLLKDRVLVRSHQRVTESRSSRDEGTVFDMPTSRTVPAAA